MNSGATDVMTTNGGALVASLRNIGMDVPTRIHSWPVSVRMSWRSVMKTSSGWPIVSSDGLESDLVVMKPKICGMIMGW